MANWEAGTLNTEKTASSDKGEETARPKRRALAVGELSELQIAAIRDANVPEQFASLDDELKDWKP
jgi:hypothetical protein